VVEECDLPGRIRASAASSNKGLELHEIDDSNVLSYYNRPSETDLPQFNFPSEGFDLKSYIANLEVKIIQDALDNTGGVVAHAAKTLGLRRTTLAEKMRKHRIDRNTENAGCGAH